MLGIALFLNCRLNNILMYIKPIFGDYIFGYLGKRPKNAKYCGYFIIMVKFIKVMGCHQVILKALVS